jgi:CRISPR-associated protein Csb2
MATAIEFRFLAGRDHATPWDRQVNEGAVEWPPAPWRILRALIATWHRKVSPSGKGEEILASLIESLAADLPRYSLPRATRAHSRHYMPLAKPEQTRLIFDAWAAVEREATLVVAWPDVILRAPERELLSALVRNMGYLGRAEGWVEGSLLEGDLDDQAWDCVPAVVGDELSGAAWETVRLPVPMGAEGYARWRDSRIQEEGLGTRRLKVKERRLLATLPAALVDALRIDADDLRSLGWSVPPGCRFETYKSRNPARRVHSRAGATDGSSSHLVPPPTILRFALGGKPLPGVEDSVRIAEVMRKALVSRTDQEGARSEGIHALDVGKSPALRGALQLLSGHDLPEGAVHAAFLPEDASGNGKLDSIMVHLPGGFPEVALRGAARIREIWREPENRWPTVLESSGTRGDFGSHPYFADARTWESVTPYLHPWFRKRGFGIEEQIVKECGLRGWPPPLSLVRLDGIAVGGRSRRAVHFHRFRDKHGLRQPDRRGSLWRITFPTAVAGPVTLGFGRFYGLGLFRAVPDRPRTGPTHV